MNEVVEFLRKAYGLSSRGFLCPVCDGEGSLPPFGGCGHCQGTGRVRRIPLPVIENQTVCEKDLATVPW